MFSIILSPIFIIQIIISLSVLEEFGKTILSEMEKRNDLYIPQYDEVYKEVLRRYHDDFRKEGSHSYDYKLNSGRIITK